MNRVNIFLHILIWNKWYLTGFSRPLIICDTPKTTPEAWLWSRGLFLSSSSLRLFKNPKYWVLISGYVLKKLIRKIDSIHLPSNKTWCSSNLPIVDLIPFTPPPLGPKNIVHYSEIFRGASISRYGPVSLWVGLNYCQAQPKYQWSWAE